MIILGVRCSPKDFSFCVIEGAKAAPAINHTQEIVFPSAYAKPLLLKWLMAEVDDLIKKYSINSIAIKSSEMMASRDKSFVERLEYETIFILAGALQGLKPIVKKVKATIAKDLGLKGKASYLSILDTSSIPNYSKYSDKMKEAVLVGWSELKNNGG